MTPRLQPVRPSPHGPLLSHLWLELLARERRLALYGALLLVLMLPMALALGLDDRELRGAPVWIKPLKFALSIAVLAWTTAWFVGHLVPARQRGRAIDRIVWTLIAAGTFELGYITLQAALGQGSHYNVGDWVHGTLYTLMGLGALALTATQPMLAWQLHRHSDARRPAALRLSVQLGLWLTFAFGAGVGMLLSSVQPPDAAAGNALPVLGWSWQGLLGGDLRPAHFIGIHAGQALPLAAAGIAAIGLQQARRWVWAATALYTLAFAAATGLALGPRFGLV